MNADLNREWLDLLRNWHVGPAAAGDAFVEIWRQYASPGRFYHTLDHIRNVLTTLDNLDAHVADLPTVKLAAWLHDAIYDSKAADNEERSAEFAQRLCERLAIPAGRAVADLILKTKTHNDEGDPNAQALLDADLAILGASESDYRQYAGQIRQEYAWVPELEYRTGRRGVLERFLARPRIFHFLTHQEEPARRNLATEIAELGG